MKFFSIIVLLLICIALVNCILEYIFIYPRWKKAFTRRFWWYVCFFNILDEEIDENIINEEKDSDITKNVKKSNTFTNKANKHTKQKSKTSHTSKTNAKVKKEKTPESFLFENDYTIGLIYVLIVVVISVPSLFISKKAIGLFKSVERRLSFYYRIYLIQEDYLSYMVLQDLKIKYPDYAVYDNERWRNVLIKHKNIFQRKSFILLNEIKAENDQEKFLTTIETISKGKLFYEENNMKLSVNMNVYIYICCLFCI